MLVIRIRCITVQLGNSYKRVCRHRLFDSLYNCPCRILISWQLTYDETNIFAGNIWNEIAALIISILFCTNSFPLVVTLYTFTWILWFVADSSYLNCKLQKLFLWLNVINNINRTYRAGVCDVLVCVWFCCIWMVIYLNIITGI